eukprot:scaffold310373_cov67-Attheya_sp.AAC.1
MARGQSKPSTQGLRDAASLATIGIILNGGERMLVAEPDANSPQSDRQGGSETSTIDSNRKRGFRHDMDLGIRGWQQGGGWSCGSKTVRTDHTLVSVAGGKVVVGLVAARRGWGTLVSVAGGKVVVCKKLEHRSWTVDGEAPKEGCVDGTVDGEALKEGCADDGAAELDGLPEGEILVLGLLDKLGIPDGTELGISEGIADEIELGISDGTADGERLVDGWRDGALLTDGAAELAGLSEGEILVLGILNRLGIPDGTELGVSDGKELGVSDGMLDKLGLSDGTVDGEALKEGCADSIKLGTSEGRVNGMELGTSGGTVDDGAAEVDELPEGGILVLGLLDKLGIPDGTELGVSDGSADGTEIGILDGSADGTELAISDSKLDGAALVDGETDGTKL